MKNSLLSKLNKRFVALLVALVMGVGIAAPKAHADDPPSAIMFSSGLTLVGGGVAALIFFDNDEPALKYGLGIPLTGLGIGVIVWGFFMLADEGGVSKIENDPVLKHVSLDSTAAGLNLGVHFAW